MDEAQWRESLQSHPIFQPKASSSLASSSTADSSRSTDDGPAVAVRQSDLIVAVGSELRVLDLSAVAGSSRHEASTTSGSSLPAQHKTLRCSAVDFPVLKLAVNTSGTLLAAIGEFELAVISLPKASYATSVETTVECQGAKVGQLDIEISGSSIADVKWHPWAESYSTLLVMTQDGVLREYNVNADLTEPQQVLSFLPKQGKASRRRTGAFSIDAGASTTAVSFAIGKGEADWGPLTLYGLMLNGDVWTICPYLPQRAFVSQSYIDAMTLVLDTKAQALRQSTSSGLNSSVKSRALAGARTGSQQRYIRAIADQIRRVKASNTGGMDVDSSVERFAVRAPDDSIIASRQARQGPFLLQPAPDSIAAEVDLGPGVEDEASDLLVLTAPRVDDGNADGASLTVLAILWKEGRVDLCLELDKVEALWESNAEEVAPHALLVYESIDLGLVASLGKDAATVLAGASPSFTEDPLDSATFYVTHATGSHMIEAGEWMSRAQGALFAGKASSLDDLRREAGLSETTHLLDGPPKGVVPRQWRPLTIAADIRLPYTAITCTASGRAVVIPLGETPIAVLDTAVNPAAQEASKDNEMLLSAAFSVEPKAYRDIVDRTGRAAIQVLQTENMRPDTKIKEIGTKDLRCLGKLAEVYATGKNEIERTSATVESRLEMQVLEMSRQLKRIQGMLGSLKALKAEDEEPPNNSLKASQTRLDAARKKQNDLLERLDGVTKSLMQEANPELSIQETKWIEELDRMKALVGDAGSHRSLQGRIAAARTLLESQKAALPAKTSTPSSPASFGHSQLTRIEHALGEENASIAAVVAQLSDLTSKMSELKMRSAIVPIEVDETE